MEKRRYDSPKRPRPCHRAELLSFDIGSDGVLLRMLLDDVIFFS